MSSFKKPDLTAPRFRSKTICIMNQKLYNAFIKKYPKYVDTDMNKFKNIIATYNGMLWQGVIDNRDGIKLPENLGHLLIAKCDKSKKQSENTDYAASAKYGKKVNHANWDSDNYLAKICYTNYSVKNRFSDRELWGFKAVKQFKSSVAGNFGELYNKYIHLTHNIKLGTLYKNV